MFKQRYSIPGSPPATLAPISGETRPPLLKVLEFDAQHIEERRVEKVADLPLADDRTVRWIEMNGLGDIEELRALGEKYGLHPLALEDALNTGQRPKMESFDRHVFIVAQMVYRDKQSRLCGEQVSMFVCKNMLITIQEEPDADVFEPVRVRLRNSGSRLRKQKADYLAYALLDAIIDHVFPVLEGIGETIEALEDELLEAPSKACVQRLHELKRILAQLRRFIWPERDVINSMLHDNTGLISQGTKVFLRDAYDHTVQIMDLIESYRDVTSGLMEMYLSAVGMRTNEIMRLLTVMSSIFIPLTFIAGVYGMNFSREADGKTLPLNMPELYQPHGYLVCLIVMLVIAVAQIVFFRRKKWI